MDLILIAVHKEFNPEEAIIGFRVFDKETNTFKDVDYNETYEHLINGNVTVDGLEIQEGKIVGSNGNLNRYTSLVYGQVFGNSTLVIIKEYPDGSFSTVNCMGHRTRMRKDYIVLYHSREGLANAKIVNKDNDTFISRINGEMEKDKSFRNIKATETLKGRLKLLNVTTYKIDEQNLAYYDSTESEQTDTLKIAEGCLGIRFEGFKNHKATKIILPSTCVNIGARAFCDMKDLKQVILPEGLTKISIKCFENCESLEEIDLPNSLVEIQMGAFKGCKKLKLIRTGPKRPRIHPSALPQAIRMIPRR